MAYQQFDEAIDEFQEQGRTIVEDLQGGAIVSEEDAAGLLGSKPVRVTLALPLSIYAATNTSLPIWARVGFGIVAGVTALKEKKVIGAQLNKLRNLF